jgi:hypothetical protein
VAGRWDQWSASALIRAGRKEAERARGQHTARRPTSLERAVTWGGRGASEDGEERGAAHLPARGVPAAGQGPAGRREAYRALFKAHLDDALVERIREATNGNYALGDRRFQAEIEQALGRRVTKSKAGRPKAQPEHRRGATRLAVGSWSVPYFPSYFPLLLLFSFWLPNAWQAKYAHRACRRFCALCATVVLIAGCGVSG